MRDKGLQHKCILNNALSPAQAGFIEPMLCHAARELPEGQDWRYEVKLDGYRAIGVKTAGRVQLRSRNRRDFTRRFLRIAEALAYLPDETILDVEIVALDSDGLSSLAMDWQ